MLLSHLSILLATLAIGGLDVRSSGDCPSGAAIAARLAPLLAGQGDGDMAWVELEARQPPALRVRLVQADVNVIVDRRLPVQGG